MKNIKHYYASANTGNGFVGKFDNILSNKKEGFMFVLKGGPGTGKSTLMKTIGQSFCEKFNIEYFHCSSDSNSLDSVKIVEKNICIVDGTFPHVAEANIPGVDSKIINIGEFIDDNVSVFRNDIEQLLLLKKTNFDLCYQYLKVAKDLFMCNNIIYSKNANNHKEQYISLKNKLKLKKSKASSEHRELFLEIFDNVETSFEQTNQYNNVEKIYCDPFAASEIMKKITTTVQENGNDITIFLNPLNPNLIKSLYIPGSKTYIKNDYYDTKPDSKIIFNSRTIDSLTKHAVDHLVKAREYHKEIEKIYSQHVNFSKLDDLQKRLICEINAH